MAVGRLDWWTTFLRVCVATVRVCVPTILEALTGRYDRSVANGRARWWSNRLLRLVGARVEVSNPHGIHPVPGRATVIMSNHASHFDIPVIYSAIDGSIRMLAKKELRLIPIFGFALKISEFIFVDRANHDRAMEAMEQARSLMRDGIAIWLSPEGTRARGQTMGPFKKGGFMLALQTGADIIPVGIVGTQRILPPENFFHMQRGERVMVRVGKPIDTSAYSVENRDALIERVRSEIAELSHLPADHPGEPPTTQQSP